MQQQAEERKFMLEAEQEATQNALDRETNIKIAEIRAAGYGSMVDINKNEQSDFIDAMEYLDKKEAMQAKMDMERNKEERTTMIENKKLAMKEKELQVKENIANKQLQIAKENKNKYDSKKTK